MKTFLMVIHVLSALAVVGLVLVQNGKGADVGAAFGSGASGSLFGPAGSANFLSRSTAIAALLFFVTGAALTYLATHQGSGSIMERVAVPASSPTSPAAPAKSGSDVPK